jgi:hypothetical protein
MIFCDFRIVNSILCQVGTRQGLRYPPHPTEKTFLRDIEFAHCNDFAEIKLTVRQILIVMLLL